MRTPLVLAVAILLAGCTQDRSPAPPATESTSSAVKDRAIDRTAKAMSSEDGVTVTIMEKPESVRLRRYKRAQDEASAPSAKKAVRPEVASTVDKLKSVGFPGLDAVDWSRFDEDYTPSPGALLEHAGLGEWFDAETGTFPNRHDVLLAQLAGITGSALDGVAFEEIAPKDYEADEEPYQLRAYADGKRWAIEAQNLGDWFDVDAVLKLLNAVLRDRGSDWRLLMLETQDQTAKVAAGPASVLVAALREGLLESGDPDSARTLGKEFEDAVRARLQGESR
ncbi:hypothetical protein [Tahibacter amnicola]|uniref:Lipoprotein n=1 Tax=Tahibacter amnicola TaxID=2976241 RepID=A0ABY6BCY2_9GAMM|nr:hypothetical protein [Tahibacter amnicola]UXI67063.1 hypothetical protein N4264_20260 [Tahibacter amnicola]